MPIKISFHPLAAVARFQLVSKIDLKKNINILIHNLFSGMIFSFGKKASSNVMNTAYNLKDVIEKKTLIG